MVIEWLDAIILVKYNIMAISNDYEVMVIMSVLWSLHHVMDIQW